MTSWRYLNAVKTLLFISVILFLISIELKKKMEPSSAGAEKSDDSVDRQAKVSED